MKHWQLIENQPLLRQIYKEPPILSRDNFNLSRDNLSKKKKIVMSLTGHRTFALYKLQKEILITRRFIYYFSNIFCSNLLLCNCKFLLLTSSHRRKPLLR